MANTPHLWFALILSVACPLAGCHDEKPLVDRTSVSRAYPPALGLGDTVTPDTLSDTSIPDADTGIADTGPDADTADTADTATTDTTPPQDTADTTADTADTNVGAPDLRLAASYALPIASPGAGAVSTAVSVPNAGGAGAVSVQLSGDPRITATAAPSVAAGQPLSVQLAFSGGASPGGAETTLTITSGANAWTTHVSALVGRTGVPSASWSPLSSPDGVFYGEQSVVGLDSAPFPHSSGSWDDDSVLVFVPSDLRPRQGMTDFVVHFHGFGTRAVETVEEHFYREQVYASGANAVLVVPQGPENASSGNFGRLMTSGGLDALLRDVNTLLYRDGLVRNAFVGDVILTAHSGGYQAVANNLDAQTERGQTTHAHLFDGLYARSSDFISFVGSGGFFRSNYTQNGGTKSNNESARNTLSAASAPTFGNLRNADAVIWLADTGHNQATFHETAFAEALRWSSSRSRRGPRIELEAVTATGTNATARWLSPRDDDLDGFSVETSEDGLLWQSATTAPASASQASFTVTAGVFVRIVPLTQGVEPADQLPSDTYWVAPNPGVLVVDGFDRLLGSFSDHHHDFTGRIAQAASAAGYPSASASNEGVLNGEVSLASFDAVIWLLGDESTADHTLTSAEQALVDAYLDQGGAVIVSGSEVGWDLDNKNNGRAFLTGLGARYDRDDSGSLSISGVGALAGVGSFSIGGPGAAYEEDFPDSLDPASGASAILRYGGGDDAAVGIPGQSAVAGFPLELITPAATATSVVGALLDFVGM